MLISILVPIYNSEKYIEKMITSINTQDDRNGFEVIFADGGSDDKTLSIIEEKSLFSYKIVNGPDKNMYDGLNKAAKLAAGKYLMFLNSDDVLSRSCVMKNVKLNLKSKRSDLVFCSDIEKVSFDGKKTKIYRYVPTSYKALLISRHSTFLPHPGVIIPKNLLLDRFAFDVSLGAAADYDFCLRILKHCKVQRLPILTHTFIRRPDSLSHSESFESSKALVFQKHNFTTNNIFIFLTFYFVWSRYKIMNYILSLENFLAGGYKKIR